MNDLTLKTFKSLYSYKDIQKLIDENILSLDQLKKDIEINRENISVDIFPWDIGDICLEFNYWMFVTYIKDIVDNQNIASIDIDIVFFDYLSRNIQLCIVEKDNTKIVLPVFYDEMTKEFLTPNELSNLSKEIGINILVNVYEEVYAGTPGGIFNTSMMQWYPDDPEFEEKVIELDGSDYFYEYLINEFLPEYSLDVKWFPELEQAIINNKKQIDEFER